VVPRRRAQPRLERLAVLVELIGLRGSLLWFIDRARGSHPPPVRRRVLRAWLRTDLAELRPPVGFLGH
jgi:hypothetical protein